MLELNCSVVCFDLFSWWLAFDNCNGEPEWRKDGRDRRDVHLWRQGHCRTCSAWKWKRWKIFWKRKNKWIQGLSHSLLFHLLSICEIRRLNEFSCICVICVFIQLMQKTEIHDFHLFHLFSGILVEVLNKSNSTDLSYYLIVLFFRILFRLFFGFCFVSLE